MTTIVRIDELTGDHHAYCATHGVVSPNLEREDAQRIADRHAVTPHSDEPVPAPIPSTARHLWDLPIFGAFWAADARDLRA